MYGLPENFNGSFLVGRTLEMVCFNMNQVYFHFDANTSITVESALSYKKDVVNYLPIVESNLMELIGYSISDVKGDADGNLNLLFSNGHSLMVYETTKQYESYRISYNDNVIIV